MGINILVTGGGGYIGVPLIKKLNKQGYNIFLYDNFSKNSKGVNSINNLGKVKIIEGNLTDFKKIKQTLKGIDIVIHLAAISDGRAGKENPEITKRINEEAMEYLANESKVQKVSRFIFLSTFSVYGNKYDQDLTEDLELRPTDPYSCSKYYGEQVLKRLNSGNYSTVSLRSAMVYGHSPSMRFEFIVNAITMSALREKKIVIFGGEQKRPQIHLNDLNSYIHKCINIDKKLISGEVFNVGSQNPSILDIAKEVKKQLDKTQIEILPKRNNEDSFVLNSKKIVRVFGYKPRYRISDGIKSLINKYGNKL